MTKLRSYLVLSDVHLGARTTIADEIIAHLVVFFDNFSDTGVFTSLDAIFIAGDLWDDTVPLASDAVGNFILFFDRFLKWCSRHDISVRILEGTRRHDRGQSATFSRIAQVLSADLDFKYVPTLSIEYMKKLDMHVLYVPDECRTTAQICQNDVEALLNEHRLSKVDIAIMHGMFKYQLGSIPDGPTTHNEAWYLDHVKYYISIGHIHTYSQYSRIVAQGSFDRLSHGQEEAKGAVLIKEISPNEWGHFFIENTLAKKYVTIDVRGDIDASFKIIDKAVKRLPDGSYIRLRGEASLPIFQGFDTLRLRYPLLSFSKKTIEEEEDEVKITEEDKIGYVSIVLNRETITSAILDEMKLTTMVSEMDEAALIEELDALHF